MFPSHRSRSKSITIVKTHFLFPSMHLIANPRSLSHDGIINDGVSCGSGRSSAVRFLDIRRRVPSNVNVAPADSPTRLRYNFDRGALHEFGMWAVIGSMARQDYHCRRVALQAVLCLRCDTHRRPGMRLTPGCSHCLLCRRSGCAGGEIRGIWREL